MADIGKSTTGVQLVDPGIPQAPPPPPPPSALGGGSFTITDVPASPPPPSAIGGPSALGGPPAPTPVPPPPPPVSGGIPSSPTIASLGEFIPTASPPPPPPPSPASSETMVIPPLGSEMQFVPQGLAGDINPTTTVPASGPPPVIPKRGGGILRTMMLFVLLLLIIGGIAAGGYFGYQRLNQNKAVTLTYWGLWENDAIIAPAIAQFQAQHPNITVQYVKQNHRQYRERLQSALERGEGPDVFRFHATWIPMLKKEIQPVPSTVMPPSEFSSKFYKVATQDLLAGSTLWGIPMMVEGLGLYVNEDLLATAGVAAPQTYEDLLAMVPKLTVKNGNAIVTSAIALGTTNNVEHFSDILGLMVLQNGGKLTDPTGKEAEEALVFYRKFATPADPLYTWNDQMDNSVAAFANGRVAMIIAPSWRAFDVKALNPDLRFHIEPVPQLPGNTITWASYWVEGVSSKSKNQQQAMEFLSYITSKEAVTSVYTEAGKLRLFGEPYALVELGTPLAADPFVGAYLKQAPNAHSFPVASLTHDNGINDRMIKYMEDAINGVATGIAPQEALSTMAQGFRQVLTSYGLTSAAP